MVNQLPTSVRVGGSALPDGVMMLTPLACAIAREAPDGGFTIESFALPPHRPNPLEKVPFLRILPKLFAQMTLVVRGWKPGRGRVPKPIIALLVGLAIISTSANLLLAALPAAWHAASSSVLQLGLFFGLIAVTRLIPQLGRIWRFHGGEHQAIAAYEAGLDLTLDNTRRQTLYHPRCGTNLATFALLIMVPGMIFGSMLSGVLGYIVTLLIPLPSLCVAFEVVMLGQKARALLWPGLAFQHLTVAMPGRIESLAGIAALQAALEEHARVEMMAEEHVPELVPAGAAQ